MQFDPTKPPEPPPASVLGDLSAEGFAAYEDEQCGWLAEANRRAGSVQLLDLSGASPAIAEKIVNVIVKQETHRVRVADYMASHLREALR